MFEERFRNVPFTDYVNAEKSHDSGDGYESEERENMTAHAIAAGFTSDSSDDNKPYPVTMMK